MRLSPLCLALSLLPVAAAPARGCETALVLAMDVSGSIDPSEYRIQIDGLAAALDDPEIREILIEDRVALTVTQWSTLGQQAQVLPWTRMTDRAAVESFAQATRALPRAYTGADTAVGQALEHALDLFAAVPDCVRRVVDMSGDGDENVGHTATRARNRAQDEGVEVNALAIEMMGPSISNFYRRWVITPRGFVETAKGHLDFPRAIRAKLLRELTRPSA